MTKTMSVLFVVTVLLSAAFATSFMMQDADAKTARGSGLTKKARSYGLNTSSQVCGDKLCLEGPNQNSQRQNPEPEK
jgi:hypothetical protein